MQFVLVLIVPLRQQPPNGQQALMTFGGKPLAELARTDSMAASTAAMAGVPPVYWTADLSSRRAHW